MKMIIRKYPGHLQCVSAFWPIRQQLRRKSSLSSNTQVLCDLSQDLSPQVIVARRSLPSASRQELQTRQPRSAPAYKDPLKEEPPAPAPAPASDPFLPPNRFPLVGARRAADKLSPPCLQGKRANAQYSNVMHFENHVATVHKINLRPRVFPYWVFSSCDFPSLGIQSNLVTRVLVRKV